VASEPDPADGATPALERRLATILSADVAGYSRMMGINEEATVQTLRGHRAVFDALLKQHRGRVFNTAGDAILAEFPSAVDAVRCATEIQTALQTRNEHLPPDQKMQFRMGINLGDVVVQEGDLLGDGVNVASRIQTVAEPGGICISGSVFDQIQNKLSLQFKPLGEQQFKNIGQPIRTFTITHGEGGALPVASVRAPARSKAVGAVALIALAAVAAGGYGLYRLTEGKRAEQDAQMAAEKAALEDARRTADTASRRAQEAESRADRERAGAEAARREAALQAQLQSAEEARRRAEGDRKRLEDERQRAEADRRAAEARLEAEKRDADAARAEAEKKLAMASKAKATPLPAPAPVAGAATGAAAAAAAPSAARAAPAGSVQFDGAYTGTMCNFPNNPDRRLCWPVELKIQSGISTASWPSRIPGKRSAARLTIAADATANLSLDGWNVNDGMPLAGSLTGRVADNRLDLQGHWANGAPVEGHWTRLP